MLESRTCRPRRAGASRDPYECGFEKYINIDSDVDFLGKEKLKKIKSEGVKKKLMGVKIDTKEISVTGSMDLIDENNKVILIDKLKNFNLTLRKNSKILEQGKSKNILEESPLAALRSYIEFCEKNLDWLVLDGLITTGTITDAYDINKADVFSCELDRLFEKKFVVKF